MIKIFTSQQGQLALLSYLKIFQLVLVPFFRQFSPSLGVQKTLVSFIPGKSSSATFIYPSASLVHQNFPFFVIKTSATKQFLPVLSSFLKWTKKWSFNFSLFPVTSPPFSLHYIVKIKTEVFLLIEKEIIHHSSPGNIYILLNLWLCTANPTRPKSLLTLQTSRYELKEWGLQQMHSFTQGNNFTICLKITLIWFVSCTIPSSLHSQCHSLISWMTGTKMNTL